MTYREWARSRARLHHDWLHNRYLVFLSSAKQDLDAATGCKNAINEELAEQVSQWWDKREQWTKWVAETEHAISPRQYLYEPPLDTLPEYHREWLGTLLHEEYCQASGIRDKTTSMLDKLAEIDTLVAMCESPEKRENAPESLRRERLGHLLAEKCHELSLLVSQLPHNVFLP